MGSGSEVAFDISWGDGTTDTVVTADALAAQQDEMSHVYNTATTSDITVSLWVNGVSYGEVGSLAVGVDMSDATTTGIVASSTIRPPDLQQSVFRRWLAGTCCGSGGFVAGARGGRGSGSGK